MKPVPGHTAKLAKVQETIKKMQTAIKGGRTGLNHAALHLAELEKQWVEPGFADAILEAEGLPFQTLDQFLTRNAMHKNTLRDIRNAGKGLAITGKEWVDQIAHEGMAFLGRRNVTVHEWPVMAQALAKEFVEGGRMPLPRASVMRVFRLTTSRVRTVRTNPLKYEVERLRKILRDHGLGHLIDRALGG